MNRGERFAKIWAGNGIEAVKHRRDIPACPIPTATQRLCQASSSPGFHAEREMGKHDLQLRKDRFFSL
jgi:hypothetical protein